MKIDKAELERRTALFVRCLYAWQELLKFCSVEINANMDAGDMEDARALWIASTDGRTITVLCDRRWIAHPDTDDEDIRLVTFHEIFEAQFFRISQMLRMHHSGEVVGEVVHEIVRRAENSIFPVLKERLDLEV